MVRALLRALITGEIRGEEFHLVGTTWYPSLSSHFLNSLRWVVFPEPSGPSKVTRYPRFSSFLRSRSISHSPARRRSKRGANSPIPVGFPGMGKAYHNPTKRSVIEHARMVVENRRREKRRDTAEKSISTV